MPDKHEQFGIKGLNMEQDTVTRTMINKNYFLDLFAKRILANKQNIHYTHRCFRHVP